MKHLVGNSMRVVFLILGLLWMPLRGPSLDAESAGHWSARCRYCGSVSFGRGCIYSPDRLHVHVGDEKHCVYCGSSSYGSGCIYNPNNNRRHLHGHGNDKCVYCGSTSTGRGCIYSPSRVHER